MTYAQIMRRLDRLVEKAGSQTKVASELGVSPSLINMVLLGRLDPPRKLLTAMGLERVVSYRKIKQ